MVDTLRHFLRVKSLKWVNFSNWPFLTKSSILVLLADFEMLGDFWTRDGDIEVRCILDTSSYKSWHFRVTYFQIFEILTKSQISSIWRFWDFGLRDLKVPWWMTVAVGTFFELNCQFWWKSQNRQFWQFLLILVTFGDFVIFLGFEWFWEVLYDRLRVWYEEVSEIRTSEWCQRI